MTRVQLMVMAGVLAGAATGGWFARGWLEDSQRLSAMQAAEAAIDAAMARESTIARAVEDRLAELEANERIIDRGVIREIEKPIYRRVCLEPDAIRLLNHAAAGTAPEPAEPDAAMPEGVAPAD